MKQCKVQFESFYHKNTRYDKEMRGAGPVVLSGLPQRSLSASFDLDSAIILPIRPGSQPRLVPAC